MTILECSGIPGGNAAVTPLLKCLFSRPTHKPQGGVQPKSDAAFSYEHGRKSVSAAVLLALFAIGVLLVLTMVALGLICAFPLLIVTVIISIHDLTSCYLSIASPKSCKLCKEEKEMCAVGVALGAGLC